MRLPLSGDLDAMRSNWDLEALRTVIAGGVEGVEES